MTVTVFGYVILISLLHFLLNISFDWADISNTQGNDWSNFQSLLGFRTWRQAEVAARDKVAWRRRINGPTLHEERRDRWWWRVVFSTLFSVFANIKSNTVFRVWYITSIETKTKEKTGKWKDKQSMLIKVAEHNFRARLSHSARVQGLHNATMASIQRSFFLRSNLPLSVLFFLHNWTQRIYGFTLLSKMCVRKGAKLQRTQ